MQRLCLPLINVMAYTGETLMAPLAKALSGVRIDPDLAAAQQRRLEDVFAGRRPDHTPFRSDLRWWVAERYHNGTLHRDIEGHDIGKLMCWSITPVPAPPLEPPAPVPGITEEVTWSGPPVRYANGGFPGEQRTIRVTTDVGTLTAVERHASRSFAPVDHPVKTVQDLKIIRRLFELQAKHCTSPLSRGWLCIAPLTPLQMFLVHFTGVERGTYILLEHREEVESLFAFIEEVQRPVIEALAANNKVLLSVENLTSEVSGGWWDRYLGPQLAVRSKIAARNGAVYGIHHDGKLMPLFARLREAGVRYVNGVTAAPSGDVDPLEMRRLGGPDLIIQDILPQCIFEPYYPEEQFRHYVDKVIAFYRDDSRVIFGIGDLLPIDGLLSRVEYVCGKLVELTTRPADGLP